MFCTKCGFEIADEMKFCPKCGDETLNQPRNNRCISCGKELGEINVKFCPFCGKKNVANNITASSEKGNTGTSNSAIACRKSKRKIVFGVIISILLFLGMGFAAAYYWFGNEGEATEESVAEENLNPVLVMTDEGYVEFGRYEQDGDVSNGPEPIEWMIIDVDENRTVLISRYVLDSKAYNDEDCGVTWEDSSLRIWLNDDFFNSAFNDAEKSKIIKWNRKNNDNPRYATNGGENTEDYVVCLTLEEVFEYFDFSELSKTGIRGYCPDLFASATPYAVQNGIKEFEVDKMVIDGIKNPHMGENGVIYWISTPGMFQRQSLVVDYNGVIDAEEIYSQAWCGDIGVRPAIYIDTHK